MSRYTYCIVPNTLCIVKYMTNFEISNSVAMESKFRRIYKLYRSIYKLYRSILSGYAYTQRIAYYTICIYDAFFQNITFFCARSF